MRFVSLRQTPSLQPARRLRPSSRPRVEALEDRCLLSAGALDLTFNPAGSPPGVATDSALPGPEAVLVQPSGKIVLAGTARTSKGQDVFGVACFNPNGTLDTTFGNGGTAIPSFKGNGYSYSLGLAAALYPTGGPGDEKILDVGQEVSTTGTASIALVRFNANGSLDTSFGNGGLVITTFKQVAGSEGASGVVVTSAGKIVVAGDNNSGFELARYNANGSLDTSFGTGGTVYTPVAPGASAYALAQEANGDVMVAGSTQGPYSQSEWLLAAYTPGGTLDPTFGSGGLVYNSSLNNTAHAVAVYPQTDPSGNAGKIMVAGMSTGAQNFNTYPLSFSLARYKSNGTLDTTFGSGGMVINTVFGEGAAAWAVAIQPDGKVVAAGESTYGFTLARYIGDGSLDATFGSGGVVTTTSVGTTVGFRGLALQPNGDILATGAGSAGGVVARYLPSEPEVGSFTASPNPVTSGSSLTLTASNITDGNPGASITQVTFYYIDGTGTQQVLGHGTSDGLGNWTLTVTVSLAPGTYALYAQAQDSYGVFGDPLALALTVL
jgi:uncharacterized delta-60 repeat protein